MQSRSARWTKACADGWFRYWFWYFGIVILLASAQFGQTAHIALMSGSAAFLATVFLSTAATRCFDPRLMWDAAARKCHVTDVANPLVHAGVSGSKGIPR